MYRVGQHEEGVVAAGLESHAKTSNSKAIIEGEIMVDIEVYTNKGCPACVSVKHYLDRKGVDYVEKKLGKSKKIDIEFAVRTKNSKKSLRCSSTANGLAVSTMLFAMTERVN